MISLSSFGTDQELKGKGATFPLPLYTMMFDEYYRQFEINVEYEGIGSSGGIKALSNREVDFGGTDAFMNDELIAATGADIVHIPTCLGAVAVTYHLSGNPSLNLSQEVLADIFLGKITKWNDREIVALNPGVTLPDKFITFVHRLDGSGTTNIFTDFLTKISPDWEKKVGKGKTVDWPVGVGVTKNSGVAGMIIFGATDALGGTRGCFICGCRRSVPFVITAYEDRGRCAAPIFFHIELKFLMVSCIFVRNA